MNVFAGARNESPGHIVVRPISKSDSNSVDRLFDAEPTRFLTMRLHIESYGYSSSYVRIWGGWDSAADLLVGLMFRINNTMIVADRGAVCARAFAAAMDQQSGIAGFRGTLDTVTDVKALLRRYALADWEESRLLRLNSPPAIEPALLALARRAGPADLDSLADLYSGAHAMFRSRSNVAAKLAETRVFIVEEHDMISRASQIVSCALLNVEGNDAGLIGGVFTRPEARGNGYAAACTSALSVDLRRDGKLPCLFYENPIAGRVYRRLGFQDCDRWGVVYFAPERYAKMDKQTT